MYTEMVKVIIYIDVLIFTNILIDYFILSLTQKFLHIQTKEYKMIMASVIGSLFTLFIFSPKYNAILSILIKLSCSMTMCLVAFKHKDFKSLVKHIIATYFISTVFCGAMVLIHQVFRPKNMAIIKDVIYFEVEPLFLISISSAIYIIIIFIQLLISSSVDSTLVSLKISIQGQDYSCIGKIDTGSTVVEPFSGSPVIIAESSILDNSIKEKCTRIVPYKALGNNGILNAIKADKIYIDKKAIYKNVYIGIYDGEIDKTVKAIINSQIVR